MAAARASKSLIPAHHRTTEVELSVGRYHFEVLEAAGRACPAASVSLAHIGAANAAFRLHSFCQSGNAYKVALYLNCSGIAWEPVEVDFFGGEARKSDWRDSLNEMGDTAERKSKLVALSARRGRDCGPAQAPQRK